VRRGRADPSRSVAIREKTAPLDWWGRFDVMKQLWAPIAGQARFAEAERCSWKDTKACVADPASWPLRQREALTGWSSYIPAWDAVESGKRSSGKGCKNGDKQRSCPKP